MLKWENFNGIINIYEDLDSQDVQKFSHESKIKSVQFHQFESPSLNTWDILNTFYDTNPNIELAINWYSTDNLNFLSNLPSLRKLSIKVFNINDLSIIGSLDLDSLLIGETKSTTLDISFIENLTDLKTLSIDGMKKGIEKIASLTKLKSLNLRGIKASNIDWISNLTNLELLKLMYGSYSDLSGIEALERLKYIGLSRVKRIEDFQFIDSLKNLEFMHFEGLSDLVSIPKFDVIQKLKKIKLDNLKSLSDIGAIKNANNLLEFLFLLPNSMTKEIRTSLLKQAFQILADLPNIQYTNLFYWSKYKEEISVLQKKGVFAYHHSKSKLRYDVEGGWSL